MCSSDLFDMDRMNSSMVTNDEKASKITNTNQMLEIDFVKKLKEIEGKCLDMERTIEHVKEEKNGMTSEILEAERQVLLYERKIILEKEMQEALDPNVGTSDTGAMKKEIHRMELRLDQLKRRQEQMISEMERAIHKRDAITLKYEPMAKKNKKAGQSTNVKRQVQSLRNNLKLCTQANSDAESRISQREQELGRLQQTIEHGAEDFGRLERAAEGLRQEVQIATVEKQRNLASILKIQRSAKRHDEMSMGRSPRSRSSATSQIGRAHV